VRILAGLLILLFVRSLRPASCVETKEDIHVALVLLEPCGPKVEVCFSFYEVVVKKLMLDTTQALLGSPHLPYGTFAKRGRSSR
jgi:hypothetical protein